MSRNNEYSALLDRIFNARYECILSEEEMHMIRPETSSYSYTPHFDAANFNSDKMQIEVHDEIDQDLLDMVFGSPAAQTVNPFEDEDVDMRGRFVVPIHGGDIAEIISKYGALRLVNPVDVVDLSSSIESLVSYIQDAKIYKPNFRAPPKEHMDKLELLNSLICHEADDFIVNGQGNNGMANLFNMVRKGAYSSANASSTQTLTISAEARSLEFTPVDNVNLDSLRNIGKGYAFS